MLESERHWPLRGRFFSILLCSFLCCAQISCCLHYMLCIPLYHRFWQLFLLFSLESSFEHHPMSYLPLLPQYFVSTVDFHTLLSSYNIRPSIWLIIPGSEVSKTWNKTIKCSTAFPEGSDDMHVHTAAQAFWPFRRGSKEMCYFLAVLALVVWSYPGAGWNIHLGVSLKFLTLAGDLVPWWQGKPFGPVCPAAPLVVHLIQLSLTVLIRPLQT